MAFISKIKQASGFTVSYNLQLLITLAAFVGTCIFFVPASYATGYLFSKTLSMGSSNEDVRQLQILLNTDPDTQIAQQGAGSPGQETIRFGSLTKAAVVRFQKKYAQDILVPAGLAQGTGVVGALTRAKLNDLETNSVGTQSTTQNTASSNAGSVSFHPADTSTGQNTASDSDYRLYSAFPYQVAPGGTVTLSGNGLTASSLASFNDSFSMPITILGDGSQAKVSIPAVITPGKYAITLSDGSQTTKNQGFTVSIDVTQNPAPAPAVASVLPDTIGSLTNSVTVTGTGFTQDNTIYTGFGTISHVSSPDGKTLRFIPSQLSGLVQLQGVLSTKPSNAALRIDFYVMNEQGITQTVSNFKVQ